MSFEIVSFDMQNKFEISPKDKRKILNIMRQNVFASKKNKLLGDISGFCFTQFRALKNKELNKFGKKYKLNRIKTINEITNQLFAIIESSMFDPQVFKMINDRKKQINKNKLALANRREEEDEAKRKNELLNANEKLKEEKAFLIKNKQLCLIKEQLSFSFSNRLERDIVKLYLLIIKYHSGEVKLLENIKKEFFKTFHCKINDVLIFSKEAMELVKLSRYKFYKHYKHLIIGSKKIASRKNEAFIFFKKDFIKMEHLYEKI